MKYWCDSCESLIDEGDIRIVKDDPSPPGISLPPGYYTYSQCPVCGEDGPEKAAQCELCGEWHNPYEGDLCRQCAKEIDKGIEKLISDAANEHSIETEAAKQIIFDRLEEKWF